MRTTLKRGIGRGADLNGNGHAVLPPRVLTPIARYRQPPRQGRSVARRIAGFFLWLLVIVAMVAGGAAGGLYLYGHDFAAATAPHSRAMKRAAKRLDYVAPGKPAVALVLGTDHRYVDGKDPGRSDTMMLIRSDPASHTVSMLSFPRDLRVEIHCPGRGTWLNKINDAYATCGPSGPLETLRALTHIPDRGQLRRLHRRRQQARRRLHRRRPALLQQPHRPDRLRGDQPRGGLPEAERQAGTRFCALPAHGQRPLPRRTPADVCPRREGAVGAVLEVPCLEPPRCDQEER